MGTIFSIGTVYALGARSFDKRYGDGSEAVFNVPTRALHWRQDVHSSSTEQRTSKWWQYEKASGVVDGLLSTTPGSNIPELTPINLLFKRDTSCANNLGAVGQ